MNIFDIEKKNLYKVKKILKFSSKNETSKKFVSIFLFSTKFPNSKARLSVQLFSKLPVKTVSIKIFIISESTNKCSNNYRLYLFCVIYRRRKKKLEIKEFCEM
jgi:hypothetical protein